MIFEEVWEIVEEQNPNLESGYAKMTKENFKKAMRFAYNKGSSHAASSRNDIVSDLENLFGFKS